MNPRLRKRAALLLGLLALVGVAIVVRLRPAPIAYRVDWAADTRYVYRLAWSDDESVRLPVADGREASTELDIAGELTLRSYGASDGTHVVGLSLQPSSARATAFGQPLFAAGDGTLEGHEALLAISPRGEVQSLLFSPGDPETWKTLAGALASELSMTLPAKPALSWQAVADDGLGSAQLSYRALSADELERRRLSYRSLRALPDRKALAAATQTIDSRHRIVIGAGQLRALDEDDDIRVPPTVERRARLSLVLLRAEKVAHAEAPVAGRELRRPGQPVTSDLARRQLLAQRTGGMTGADLVNRIYANARGGLHDDAAWLWKATGVLIEHPEVCAELGQAFADPEMSADTRRVILDLLAGAGHAEAQAALRHALDSPAATQSRDYPLLVQRFSLVPDPTPETAQFLAQTGQRAKAQGNLDVARATHYSLGAVVGHMAAHDAETAARLNHALVDELTSARSGEDKRDALRAIGNAGLPENVALVLAERDAEDPSVRAAAAAALRKTAGPETTRALLALAGDGAEPVSAEALDSLRGRELDGAQGAELAALLPRLSAANQPQLADLLIEHLGDSAWAARALQELADRTHDPRLSARIRALFVPAT
jgi:hypothetical protein